MLWLASDLFITTKLYLAFQLNTFGNWVRSVEFGRLFFP